MSEGFNENIRKILEAYEVGMIKCIDPIYGGTANVMYRISTDKGEFVLRERNKRYSSLNFILFENEFLIYLSDHGFPVPVPVRNKSGLYHSTLVDLVYQLYPYIHGNAFSFKSSEELKESAEFLARFHRCSADFKSDFEKILPRYDDPHTALQLLDRFILDNIGARAGKEVKDILVFLRNRLDKIKTEFDDIKYDLLPKLYIHGDYHPANVKFHKGKVSGLFDFDWVSLQPRINDIADGILYFSSKRSEKLSGADIISLVSGYDMDINRAAVFINAYCGNVKPEITNAEINCLPDLITARLINNRVDALRKVRDEEKLYLLTYRILDKLDWIDNNRKELCNLFLSGSSL